MVEKPVEENLGVDSVLKEDAPILNGRPILKMIEREVPDLVPENDIPDGSLSPRAPLASQEDFEDSPKKKKDVRYEISVKEEILMTVVVKNGENEPSVELQVKLKGDSSDESVDEEVKDLDREKDSSDNNNELKIPECRACEDNLRSDTESDEDFEDCEEYERNFLEEDEGRTDFGCSSGGYLHTIEEEDEEDSELEQFEQFEQLCSSDDFDPEEYVKEEEDQRSEREERKANEERIKSFKEYKKFVESEGLRVKYEKQLALNLAEDRTGSKIRPLEKSEPSGAEEQVQESIEKRLREADPEVEINVGTEGAVREDIFTRGYDFAADGWFASTICSAPKEMRSGETRTPKSALKRSSGGGKKRKKNKVQFDESLNKFFEADYVILIREEGECEGEGCECGGYCYEEEEEEEHRGLDLVTPLYPPVEFVDQLTLSPPDGYKDHLPGGWNFDSITHYDDSESWNRQQGVQEEVNHNQEANFNDSNDGKSRLEKKSVEDNTTQTTPTTDGEPPTLTAPDDHWYTPSQNHNQFSENRESCEPGGPSTTVTDRRLVRDSEDVGDPSSSDQQRLPERNSDEMTLTFRLGNVTMANSLKPNSAVRQLFPSPRFVSPPPTRSPEDDKKSPESDEDDGLQNSLIKRTIERNTLRRSLMRYPSDIRLKRNQNKLKNENSLVERIKKLTCDVDDDPPAERERTSPTGEESKDKIPAYRKITDLFRKDKEPHPVVLQAPASIEHQYPYYQPVYNSTPPPDLGNGGTMKVVKSSVTTEARKQFLSSLAPLTACVAGNPEDMASNRDSTASSSTAETEYSLNDIDDALKDAKPQPDVVAGTPGTEQGDELALFVEQDASRIERLRKRYSSNSDDEHDDYGFNRRPSVRGIKPRFGSTTEILQQMQSQMTPPLASGSHVSWPYYADTHKTEARVNGYHRRPVAVHMRVPDYIEEPHYSQQQVRLPYQVYNYGDSRSMAYHFRVQLMGDSPQRGVVVRGTQTISTYYHIPRYPPNALPPGAALPAGPGPHVIRGPLLYYPRSPLPCGSPTKMKLERGVPEGASSSPALQQDPQPLVVAPQPTAIEHNATMMYAMNV